MAPEKILETLKQATKYLLTPDANATWKNEVVGTGVRRDKDGWKIVVLLRKAGSGPEQLQQYLGTLPDPAVTNETGPFRFLLNSGGEIDTQVPARGTLTAVVKNKSRQRFLLSCSHVLGNIGNDVSN